MFIKIEDMIINLDHVIDIYFKDERIVIFTTDKDVKVLKIEHADELEKMLAKYNEIRGYKHD